MGLLDYVYSVLGISPASFAELSTGELMIIVCCSVLVLFLIMFIIRAVLGGVMYLFR